MTATANILGLGQWVPEAVRDNAAWPAEFTEAARRRAGARELVEIPASAGDELCDRITNQHLLRERDDPFAGATRRRVADPEVTAAEAEILAARAALADAGVDPGELDLVSSWAIVPDRITPSSACRVAHALGASRAFAHGIDAACASIVAQLEIAAAMIESGRARHALLVQSHMITRAFPFMHPAAPGIGDGATAVVVGPGAARAGDPATGHQLGHQIRHTHAVTHGEFYEAVTWLRDRDEDAPWWRAAERGFYLGTLDREGVERLTQNTVRYGAQTIRELAARADVSVDRIAAIASVQPRRWVPGAIAEVLGLPADAAPQTFDELAHLGACGAVTNLLAIRERGLARPGDLVAVYAQGAGFSRSAALLRWGPRG